MGFFNESVPTLCCKQPILDTQDLQGLWHVQWGYKNNIFRSTFYTRLDQACLLWGTLCAAIFLTLQFCSINYFVQAALWSLLTLMATIATIYWTKFWVQVEQATWVLHCWAVLMVLGIAVTDLVLWLQWGQGMLYLCSLWLGFSAVGYFCNGFALRSRAITIAGVIHLSGIAILPYTAGWHFLVTGLIMVLCLWILAEFQWDMRSPIQYQLLTAEQKQFNEQQHLRRTKSLADL